THVFLSEYLQKPSVDEAMDQLKRVGVPEDEMEALERQPAPKEDSAARKLGFETREEAEKHSDTRLGALERIKRMRQGD
nr:RNA-processing protein, HAT helix [Tanacetum cinerariifolium]